MGKKVTYRVRNWKQYNQSLINRGNITLWFSEDVVSNWYAKPCSKGRGRHFTYSDACIELALTFRVLFQFPLRSTQGFLEGFVGMLGLKLKIPHYSRLSRRAGKLKIKLPRKEKSGNLDLVIDSTGLKIYVEGEWKMRTHGKQKRRTWRKYHVSVDPDSHEVVTVELTAANVHDCTVMPKLLKGLKSQNIGKIYADGAYPTKNSLDAISKVGGAAVIPPGTDVLTHN